MAVKTPFLVIEYDYENKFFVVSKNTPSKMEQHSFHENELQTDGELVNQLLTIAGKKKSSEVKEDLGKMNHVVKSIQNGSALEFFTLDNVSTAQLSFKHNLSEEMVKKYKTKNYGEIIENAVSTFSFDIQQKQAQEMSN